MSHNAPNPNAVRRTNRWPALLGCLMALALLAILGSYLFGEELTPPSPEPLATPTGATPADPACTPATAVAPTFAFPETPETFYSDIKKTIIPVRCSSPIEIGGVIIMATGRESSRNGAQLTEVGIKARSSDTNSALRHASAWNTPKERVVEKKVYIDRPVYIAPTIIVDDFGRHWCRRNGVLVRYYPR